MLADDMFVKSPNRAGYYLSVNRRKTLRVNFFTFVFLRLWIYLRLIKVKYRSIITEILLKFKITM